jgi:hypothetical protein
MLILLSYCILTIDLDINRPTKRGKEKSRSDGHYQCEKEISNEKNQQISEIEPRSDTLC